MEGIRQKISWYEEEDFEIEDPVCDHCNEPLTAFPVAVCGGYALCPVHQAERGIHAGDTIYFEAAAFNMGLEPKRIGVNCGGRRK